MGIRLNAIFLRNYPNFLDRMAYGDRSVNRLLKITWRRAIVKILNTKY